MLDENFVHAMLAKSGGVSSAWVNTGGTTWYNSGVKLGELIG